MEWIKIIIGFTGLARCGKDTVAKYIIQEYNFKHLDFARDALFAEADKRGVEKDKMSLSLLGDELRQQGGKGVLAKIIAEKMNEEYKKDENQNFVITGFRSPEEVDYIRNSVEDDFCLIEVYSEKLSRFERRTENDPKNLNDFFARDTRDIHNKGLGEVIKMADYKIENDDTLEKLFEKTDELMKKISVKK